MYLSLLQRFGSGLFILLVLLVVACEKDRQEEVPDVSQVRVDWELRRFEQDLFQLDTLQMEAALKELRTAYPEFGTVFLDRILRVKDPRIAPQGEEAFVRGFITFPALRKLYDTIQQLYPGMSREREQFHEAFQRFKYYFPGEPTPTVTTFLSEYALQVFIYGENDLAVGLDFFLGEDYPYQRYNPMNSNFSAYLTRTFNREHLVAKTLQPLVDDLVGSPQRERLLDHLVANGKKLYILDRLLPATSDTVLMEVSGEQWEWLQDNELDIWAYFLTEESDAAGASQNLLYSTDWPSVRKFVEYSPHSPGMPPEAPGRTANYLGWQIVKAWMDRHPEADLQQLIDLRDPQRLLDESRYKPRRN